MTSSRVARRLHAPENRSPLVPRTDVPGDEIAELGSVLGGLGMLGSDASDDPRIGRCCAEWLLGVNGLSIGEARTAIAALYSPGGERRWRNLPPATHRYAPWTAYDCIVMLAWCGRNGVPTDQYLTLEATYTNSGDLWELFTADTRLFGEAIRYAAEHCGTASPYAWRPATGAIPSGPDDAMHDHYEYDPMLTWLGFAKGHSAVSRKRLRTLIRTPGAREAAGAYLAAADRLTGSTLDAYDIDRRPMDVLARRLYSAGRMDGLRMLAAFVKLMPVTPAVPRVAFTMDGLAGYERLAESMPRELVIEDALDDSPTAMLQDWRALRGRRLRELDRLLGEPASRWWSRDINNPAKAMAMDVLDRSIELLSARSPMADGQDRTAWGPDATGTRHDTGSGRTDTGTADALAVLLTMPKENAIRVTESGIGFDIRPAQYVMLLDYLLVDPARAVRAAGLIPDPKDGATRTIEAATLIRAAAGSMPDARADAVTALMLHDGHGGTIAPTEPFDGTRVLLRGKPYLFRTRTGFVEWLRSNGAEPTESPDDADLVIGDPETETGPIGTAKTLGKPVLTPTEFIDEYIDTDKLIDPQPW